MGVGRGSPTPIAGTRERLFLVHLPPACLWLGGDVRLGAQGAPCLEPMGQATHGGRVMSAERLEQIRAAMERQAAEEVERLREQLRLAELVLSRISLQAS